MEQPLVYISLLTWGNADDCINCVHSLERLNYKNYQLIIRDNASPNDAYKQLLHAFSHLEVFQSEDNLGYAAGHWENYKIARESGAELFWIINSDLEIHPDALNELVRTYQKCGDHIYGSVSLQPQDRCKIDFGGAAKGNNLNDPFTYNEWKNRPYEDLLAAHPAYYSVQSVEGSSMLLPVRLVEKEGFMKLDFFMYGEETDYCYRLRKNGIDSVIVTKSIIYHKNQGSTKSHNNLSVIPAYYRRRNFLRLQKEHFRLSKWQCLSYKNGAIPNMKTILKGIITKQKDINYFYALACWHAFLGKNGKTVHPEDFV